MSLQQINSAIPANRNFSPSLSNILENIFPKSLKKQLMVNIHWVKFPHSPILHYAFSS